MLCFLIRFIIGYRFLYYRYGKLSDYGIIHLVSSIISKILCILCRGFHFFLAIPFALIFYIGWIVKNNKSCLFFLILTMLVFPYFDHVLTFISAPFILSDRYFHLIISFVFLLIDYF